MIESIIAFIIFLIIVLVGCVFGTSELQPVKEKMVKKSVSFAEVRDERVFSKKNGGTLREKITPTFNKKTDH